MKKTVSKKNSPFFEAWRRLKKNKLSIASLIILAIIVVMAVFAPVFTTYDYAKQDLSNMLQTPNRNHLFGTDNMGRDLFTRILYGARVSLLICVAVVAISTISGCIVGSLSGYFKTIDLIVQRIVDILASIPTLLLAIALAASFGVGTANLIIALGVSYAPGCIRIVRASVLRVREQEFIEAAISVGADNARIIFTHVLPNVLSPIIVQSTLNVARALISSATLSFLGLGVPPPSPEWGAMLSAGRNYIQQYPHLALFPGVSIIIVTYALNLLGDGLRDALDPHLKD